jgi:hypothetical protein
LEARRTLALILPSALTSNLVSVLFQLEASSGGIPKIRTAAWQSESGILKTD